MSFAFNSIYSYFLFLYHVLLKSIFYFNALGSVMDLFSPIFASWAHEGSHYANTTEKGFETSWIFLSLSIFLRDEYLFFWKWAGDAAMQSGV